MQLKWLLALLLFAPIASAQTTITCGPPNGCTIMGNATISQNPGAPPTVSVSPNVSNLSTTGTQNFTATVTNDGFNRGVSWVLASTGCSGAACGTLSASISASGVAITYTAPNNAPPNPITLTAMSVTNPQSASSAAATIIVHPPPPPALSVTVAPTTISVTTSATQAFTCTVLNDAANAGCDWTLGGTTPQGNLSIAHTASGTPLTYTAPSGASTAVTLTVKSRTDNTKTAVAAITVVAIPVISVNISPTTATIGLNSPQAFTATVTNDGANLGVAWTVTGGGCSGATCGTLSASTSASGVPITYTSPTTTPSPPTVTVTATSVADSTKSAAATVTISPPSIVVNSCAPAFVNAAALNTFICPPSQGSAVAILLGSSTATTVTGVQVCTTGGIVCTNMVAGCPPSGACAASIGGGMAAGYYALGLPAGQTTYKVSNSPFGNAEQAWVFDISNVTSFDTAVIGGSNTPSANPSQSITTRAAGAILTMNATLAVTAIAPPFNYVTVNNGVGGGASTVTSAAGTYTPTWTQTSADYALYTMALAGGFVSPIVNVTVNPTTASVVTSGTLPVTATVTNGSHGVGWTLAGAGCTGATCGTLSAGTSASGVPITYTAPGSVPSPATVTLTATSVDDATKTAATTITVTAAPVIGVTVAPTSANLVASGTQNFTCTVTNDSGAAGCDWTLAGTVPQGSLSTAHTASGVALTYTAPSSASSAVTLTAKSTTDPTKTAGATIAVTAPVVSVSVAPTTVTLNAGGSTQLFTATVINSASSVNWTVTGGGTITPTSGATTTYTSPASNNSFTATLTATSISDPTKSASATINVTATSSQFKCTSPCPAFPGAQGGGAATPGGRGGTVIYVTNTNSSGTGSLNACINASGARTCVFSTAGIIGAAGQVNNPFLTIACQTAPGEVIIGGPTVSGGLRVSTHDVVVRYCTFSPDSTTIVSGPDTGTVGIAILNCSNIFGPVNNSPPPPTTTGCYNLIFDHVTTRWSGNKSWITGSNFTPQAASGHAQYSNCVGGNPACGVGPNHAITVQWTLDYEPHEGHPVGYGTATDESCVSSAAAGQCLSRYETDIDFHHIMLINVDHRIPESSNQSTRWVNNIIYNWSTYANQWLGAETIDIINSKFITGQLNSGGAGPGGCGGFGCSGPSQPHPVHFTANSPELCGAPSGYMSGNIWGGPGTNTVNSNPWSLAVATNGENAQSETDPSPGGGLCPQASNTPGIAVPSGWQRSSPMAASNAFPIVADSATNLDTIMLATVGNSQHLNCTGAWVNHRDAADARIIAQYQSGGSGGFWPNGVSYAGQSTIPTPTANWKDSPLTNFTACTETLNDGIPDAWKTKYGLSTTDPNLYKTVDPVLGTQYTYLDAYLDGLVP